MDLIKVDDEEATLQVKQPLLQQEQICTSSTGDMTAKQKKPSAQKAVRKTFKGTAQLAKLLPTGTVLTFQVLSPSLTNQGKCDPMGRFLTACLVIFCGLSCYILSFTDSFRDAKGKVRYGLATFQGLCVIDGKPGESLLSEEAAAKYRLRFVDFVHASMSVLVFVAVAMIDQNLVRCFFPAPTQETKDMLVGLPIGICAVCSVLFVAFPTKRHGVGFPLSRE